MEKPKVWGKPDCVQCTATERKFKGEDIEYDYEDLSQNEEALERFKELGYTQAPIVEANGEIWSGFNPDKIKALGAIAVKEGVSYAEEEEVSNP